ncbi:glucoamylase family protein [Streptomyces sp. NPDC094049]|uniref:glucoamylase family protein n=1 Tax=Streptomyces sp. NPDC094049 TaxID=3154987 RepID=UPI00333300D3
MTAPLPRGEVAYRLADYGMPRWRPGEVDGSGKPRPVDEITWRNHFGGYNWPVDRRQGRTTWTKTPRSGEWGGAAAQYYRLRPGSSARYTEAFWGDGSTARESIDADDFFRYLDPATERPVRLDELRFKVRGSGLTRSVQRVLVTLTGDGRRESDYRSTHMVEIDDATPGWQTVSLPLDLADHSVWQDGARGPAPRGDLRHMNFSVRAEDQDGPRDTVKEGTYYLDDIDLISHDAPVLDADRADPDQFVDHLGKRAFQRLLDFYSWDNGLVQAGNQWSDGMYTSGGPGWLLAAVPVAVRRGWITEDLGHRLAVNTLRKLAATEKPEDTPADHARRGSWHGFYPQFLERDGTMSVGASVGVDTTALIVKGAYTVNQFWNQDEELASLARTITERVRWPEMLVDAGNDKGRHLSLSWAPVKQRCDGGQVPGPQGQGCLSPYSWYGATDEALNVNSAALMSTTHPVDPSVWWSPVDKYHFARYRQYEGYATGSGSLFTATYMQGWIDWARLGKDDNRTGPRVDWRHNAEQRIRAQQLFVSDQYRAHPGDYPAYADGSFGLNSATGPDRTYQHGGPLMTDSKALHDGTLNPMSVLASTSVVPDIAIPSLRDFHRVQGLWNDRSGYPDSFNLKVERALMSDPARPVYGEGEKWITWARGEDNTGAAVLAAGAYLGVHNDLMDHPKARAGLCRVFTDSFYCSTARPAVRVFNDTDWRVEYKGGWKHYDNRPQDHDGDVHAAWGDSAVTFTFWGDGIESLSTTGRSDPTLSVTLDGAAGSELRPYSAAVMHQRVLYRARGLTPGQHTLTVTSKGGQRAWFNVDAFRVYDAGGS